MIAIASLVAGLLAAAPTPDVPRPEWIRLAQASVTIRQTIVRIPLPRTPVAEPQRWRTRRGPKCVALRNVAGAAVTGPDSVDMIFRGGKRVRAELEQACPALDYYHGFYLRPSGDGLVCADRDAVHARSGGACEIERFRLLVPEKRR